MATPLQPLVKTVNIKIHTCSGGSLQAQTRKSWKRLDFPMSRERNSRSAFLSEFWLQLLEGSSFAHPLAQFCTPFQLRLPPRELPSPCSCSCIALLCGHTHLHVHAAITPGRGSIKVTPKPAVPPLLCLFNEHRKLQAWFSFAFMSSHSLSAVNIRSF